MARIVKRCPPAKVHDLYMEVYGADFAGGVTVDRARRSIQEACAQLLTKQGKETITIDVPEVAAPVKSPAPQTEPPEMMRRVGRSLPKRKRTLSLEPP